MPPQRLPIVNSDDGTWGDILRQYLLKEHYDDGTNNAANGGHKTITIRAGTASANTAPLKFTSGTLLTTPEAGAIEFNTDTLYFTQTTGATRTQIITNTGTQTLTNKTINGSNNTFSNIPQSAITNLSTDIANKADTFASPSGGDVLNNQTLNLHPEDAGFGLMPYVMNDLAYNIERGGSITYELNGSPISPGAPNNPFYPDVSYTNYTIASTSDTFVITVGMHTGRTWRYTNHVGIAMPMWLTAKDVLIEVYDTNAATWRTIATHTNTDPNLTRGIFRANTAAIVPGGNDITQLRFTITNFQSTVNPPRILSIFCVNYSSGLLSDTHLPRSGGSLYGTNAAPPTLTASGGDSNINLNLVPKGSGRIQAGGVNIPTISSADTLTNKTLSAGVLSGTTTQTGTIDFTPDTGVILSFDGTAAITRHGGGGSKSMGIGADDTLFLGAGESRQILASNIATGQETVEIGGDSGVNIHVSTDNWANWANRKTTAFTGTGITWDGNQIWHAGNDGAGSGLDADTLDGIQAASFATLAGSEVLTNKTINASNNTISNIALSSLSTTGTANSTTYLRGDGQWTAISSGGITRTFITTSGNYSVGSSASTDYIYIVAGAHAGTLPTANGNANRYTFKNNHSASVTLTRAGADTIEGDTSITLEPGVSVDLISNGTNTWNII